MRVPASSANLGPGFDALGMALSMHAEIGTFHDDVPERARAIDEHHPATVAYRRSGGHDLLWERCPIPSGRGLGFSGAVRVAGAVLAHAQRRPAALDAWREDTEEIFELVAKLEGHADNAAASLFGGVVATAGGRVVRVPLGMDPTVVVWIPSFVTSTDESRRALGGDIPFEAAVFNLGRTALLVAALCAGDVPALRVACEDQLHQASRFVQAEPSRRARQAALDAGAWCAWLSGSGPTVAAMCAADDAATLAAALPADGHAKILRIDRQGATVESP